ncbi:glycosyltransferase family 2 protein [Vibrio sp. SS-MA-C1-2]|uniref:glycosyltransferase family 2 protein n=1 Tax=Vibrio sp. SS-MA-C1-2 TaxID=2908646 RepID=UPI001F3732D0|nr:glycosyltransferase family 2 protein [Vibrio sp. SS-MA-C1-2]UJF18546.1 glycosyltransferase family 2 protein [Vibrio sp. SS-MA-C1-2]
MTIFISIISHKHERLIKSLDIIKNLTKDYVVVLKSNAEGDDFSEYISPNFHWINNEFGLGFGHNNNVIFQYCELKLGMLESDYFIVLNPDVIISNNEIYNLVSTMQTQSHKLAAINLYKDDDYTIYDNSIRSFPMLTQFISSFIGKKNTAVIDKSTIDHITDVDWAAGSFQAFNVQHYKQLQGFDQRYFMYCEDIDICWRSHRLGESVKFYPNIRALHLAKHANRKIFSKHFYWHVTGVFRFLFTKIGIGKSTSSIK